MCKGKWRGYETNQFFDGKPLFWSLSKTWSVCMELQSSKDTSAWASSKAEMLKVIIRLHIVIIGNTLNFFSSLNIIKMIPKQCCWKAKWEFLWTTLQHNLYHSHVLFWDNATNPSPGTLPEVVGVGVKGGRRGGMMTSSALSFILKVHIISSETEESGISQLLNVLAHN